MIIRDEIHGTIEFDSLEERIIDSEEFQRLRRIRQMSVTNLVYPGANHSRFEHSLGTAHLSGIIAKRVGLEAEDAKKVRIYGLLHDIGHIAFSHEGEDILKRYLGDHEQIGKNKIADGEIGGILSENYKKGEITEVGKSKLGAIINSDLGADRMDYLKRDALNTGVAYGLIDIDRVLHTLSTENSELCISKRGLEAAEFLLVARFMMFSAVYLHRTVRIATAMLYKAIQGAIDDGSVNPEDFLKLGDDTALSRMLGSPKGGQYAKALLNRNLYKEVTSLPKQGFDPAKSQNLEKELKKKTGKDIIVDYPHSFFKPVSIKVRTDKGLLPIADVSMLVGSLEKSEQERMAVLILAQEEVAKENEEKIRKIVSTLQKHQQS